MSEVEVAGLNRGIGYVLLSDGKCIPILGWMDDEGEDCGPSDAVTCWAKEADDKWWAVDLREFIAHPTQ